MKRHKSAVYALWKYGYQNETITDAKELWEGLMPHQKTECRLAVNDILAAPDETEKQPCQVCDWEKENRLYNKYCGSCGRAFDNTCITPDENKSTSPDTNCGFCRECGSLTVTECLNCGIKY